MSGAYSIAQRLFLCGTGAPTVWVGGRAIGLGLDAGTPMTVVIASALVLCGFSAIWRGLRP